MRRLTYLVFVMIGVALMTTSCSDSENTYHALRVISASTSSDYAQLYADQQTDILKVYSTDQWSATTNADWVWFSSSGTNSITHGATYITNRDSIYNTTINVQANTTGSTRVGVVRFSTNKHNVVLPVYQVGYLNITSITPVFSDPTNHNGVSFTLTAKANETSATVSFYIYQSATITASADWVSIPNERFLSGTNTAELVLEPNTTGQSRTATISIVSDGGPTTNITLTQQG